jgi:hypothetical protein
VLKVAIHRKSVSFPNTSCECEEKMQANELGRAAGTQIGATG